MVLHKKQVNISGKTTCELTRTCLKIRIGMAETIFASVQAIENRCGGGWYLVSAREIERRRIFFDDSYYRHFLELLEGMSERYCVEAHSRQRSGMTLREIGAEAGGQDYKMVGKVVQGYDELIRQDK